MTTTHGNELQQQMAASALRLEMTARTEPQAFRVNAALMTLAGFVGLIGFSLLSFIGVLFFLGLFLRVLFILYLAALVGLALIVFVVFFWHVTGTLARTFWARMPDPKGIRIDPMTAPMLYQQINRIATTLGTPPIANIYITNEFDVALRPRMRFGIFGGLDYDLQLGLPLLSALTPEQARAAIAHELGHLSSQVPAFHAWVHRVWDLWSAMMTLTEGMDPNFVTRPYLNFLTWYTREFYVYETVIARLDDHVADQCAARIAGPEATRDALLVRAVRAYYLRESYRVANIADARSVQTPTTDLCRDLATPWPPEAPEWLHRAMSEPTHGYEHHAALATRMKTLGNPHPALPPIPTETAAPALLGEVMDEVMRQLDVLYR